MTTRQVRKKASEKNLKRTRADRVLGYVGATKGDATSEALQIAALRTAGCSETFVET